MSENAAPVPQTQALALAPPRLPYHPAIEARFGVSLSGWRALIDSVFPTAKTTEGVLLALSYCQARRLDVFKKPVHVVPMWSSALKAEVETVWPGIAEVRTTAMRTGEYAGVEETRFGPAVTRTFKGKTKDRNGNERTVEHTVEFPEWAQVTVYRLIAGQRVAFHGPKVHWLETYSTAGRFSELPNDRWVRSPFGQLEKCAEAGALRRAFPEEVGSDLTAEEMEGKVIDATVLPEPEPPATPPTSKAQAIADAARGAKPPAPPPSPAPPPDRPQATPPVKPATPPEPEEVIDAEVVAGEQPNLPLGGQPPGEEVVLFDVQVKEILAAAREARLGSTPEESEEVLRDHVRVTYHAELEDLPGFLFLPVLDWTRKPKAPRATTGRSRRP